MSSQPSTVPTNALVSDPGVKHTQVEENVEHTAPVTKSLAAPRDLHDYRVHTPAYGPARTFAGQVTIYNRPGDEGMFAVINRYLERVQWIQIMAWRNDTDATQQYQVSYTTGLTITQGSDVTNGFSLGASYEGMSIGFEHSTRTFRSTETTSSKTTTLTVNVHPRSELVFYQRRFDFRDNITFINDAWGQWWNIGPWGGYTPLTTKVTSVNIMAEEYFTNSARLPEGPGSVAVDSVAAASLAGWTRQRDNVTQRAKNVLTSMGL
ncbi:hypothetical protein GGX14DRAFT_403539 [Mycena pura]|uniref:Uncharacterized protein n=1 Tax=Mycena pura TaxID=153505 RepID=A0AAD6UXK2_9AGAR|nr:hypothetical protein GGX14DRAFT_403531 [Mycena pura]KAJ7196059.1 hypothetical protein GGX14DRAFT_403539 [Mycena pura]